MPTIDTLKGMVSSKLGLARSNNFLIELPRLDDTPPPGLIESTISPFIPSIPGVTKDSMPNSVELNTLCKGASLPGKQILTADRRVGMVNEKVAYGYAVSDISLTFNMLNDYGVKNYFDKWLSLIVEDGYRNGELASQVVKYKDSYAKPITIHQLRKPQIGFSANLGPISGNIGFGGGSVYSVLLVKAFPTTVNEITFTNDLDGIVELTVSLSFTNWSRVKPSQNFINASIGI